MDSNKMKTVKKLIIKNILAWVCILCLVLCAMPLGVSAEGDEENSQESMGSVVGKADEVDSGNFVDTSTEQRTITVKLTVNGTTWQRAGVALKGADVDVTATTDNEGSCSLTVPKDASSLTLYVNNKATPIQADTTTTELTVEFFRVEFFSGNDCFDSLTQYVVKGFSASEPEAPKRTGYSFAGWKDAKENGSNFDFSTPINEATKLYDSWTENQPDTHTHEWDKEWAADESYHWHICTADDCPIDWTVTENISDNAKDYAAHEYGKFEVVKPATCSEEGLEKRTCVTCGYEEERSIAKLTHSFDEEQWETDEDSHWHICSLCGASTEKEKHIERWAVTTRPTVDETGERTYTCGICNKVLRTEEIPALGENHTHAYDKEWLYNNDYHWKECICGAETMKVLHTWDDGRILKEPTAEAEGTRIYTCTICGAESEVSIPRKEGIVEKGTSRGQNAPDAEFAMDTKELAGIVLTEKELQDNSNARITLTINNITSHVDIRDRVAVEQMLGAYQVGQYLDITLCKEVDSNEKDWITETNDKLRIAIHVPSTLLNYDTGRITRTYAVVRVHDGKAEILQDLDNSLDIITIETDRFSTYAIIYRDTVNGSGNQGDDNNPDDSGNSGNNGGNSGNNGSDSNNGDNSGNTNNGDNSSNNNSGNSGNNNSGNNNGGNSGSGTTEGNNSSNGGTTINNYTINNTTFSSSINTTDGNKAKGTPQTGDAMAVNLYATLAMISGLGSIFYGRQGRMTEEDKEDLISAVSRRAKNRGITGKCFAVFAIASILLYYHTVGKRGKVKVQ